MSERVHIESIEMSDLNKKSQNKIDDTSSIRILYECTEDARKIVKDNVRSVSPYVWVNKNREAIEKVVKSGNLTDVKRLISDNIIRDSLDFFNTILFGIDHGQLHIIEYLIEYLIEQYDIDVDINNGYLLIRSIKIGNLDIIMYFIKKGVDIHRHGHFNVLKISAEQGHAEVFKYFVWKGADTNTWADYSFQISAENGYFEIVKFLVGRKMVDISGYNNRAVLVSYLNGYFDIWNYLIEHGASDGF